MWENYRAVVRRYPKLSLVEERRKIRKAQAGSKVARDELVLGHIGFVMWRIQTKIFPEYLERHGDDILSAAIMVLYQKIQTYNLRYLDRKGVRKPVKFVSYIWKRIDGLAIDYIKRERRVMGSYDSKAQKMLV
jgi:DNA-directed RNA polymerase specialized sigma subunit